MKLKIVLWSSVNVAEGKFHCWIESQAHPELTKWEMQGTFEVTPLRRVDWIVSNKQNKASKRQQSFIQLQEETDFRNHLLPWLGSTKYNHSRKKKSLHFHLEQNNFSNYMCGHFLLRLQSGFHSSIEECQMKGNNLFKIAQTRITGLTHWQIYVFSAYIFSYISFSKGCSSVAIETISSLFSLPQGLFWGITTAASQATVCVSCPEVAKGKQ